MNDERVGGAGDEASEEVLRRVRAETRAVGGDLLAGLPERAKERPEEAFDPIVIDAAVSADDVTYQRLRRELKSSGVPIGQWDAAIKAARTRRRAEEREQLVGAATARRRIEEEEAVERRKAFDQQRETASGDFAAHFAEATMNSITYRILPGTVEMEESDRSGPVVTCLAKYSSPIVADLLEFDSPIAKPRRSIGMSVLFDGDTDPSKAEKAIIPVGDLERMTWPERLFGSRGACAPGKVAREHLRTAIMLCSRARVQRRYRFVGRVVDGEPIHVHAGGAVSARGPVDDVDVYLDDPASRFEVLLPGSEEELRAALRSALMLFDAAPYEVSVLLVAAAFRAPLEDSSLTLHVAGRKGTGKSLMCGIASTFFGPATVGPELYDHFPASWADLSSPKGLAKVLSICGNVLLGTDDLKSSGNSRTDEQVFKTYEAVTRSHFNRSCRRILTVESEARTMPPTRCTILSNGEIFPRGHSTRDRIVSVELGRRPVLPPGLLDAARDGTLARAMGPYIVRCLGESSLTAAPIGRREAAAAKAWGLGADNRSAALFGALALGLDGLFTYLIGHGFGAADIDHRRRIAEETLKHAQREQESTTAAEDPARVFCRLIGDALRSGIAHVARINPAGEPCEPSASPPAWGWGKRYNGWEPNGLRIGRLEDDKKDVLLDPGPALTVARQIAQRDGTALAVDREGLAHALRAAGLLARTDVERRTLYVRARIGAGIRTPHLAVRLDAFDLEIEGASPSAIPADAAPSGEYPPRDHEPSPGDLDF